MSSGRTTLHIGARVLTENGTAVVISICSSGLRLRDTIGQVREISWAEMATVRAINDGEVAVLCQPLRPIWDTLDTDAKNVALGRLEVVQEILTGYRNGHPELARQGEPRTPFGPGFGISESRRCQAMAATLSQEGQADRLLQRRVDEGAIRFAGTSPSTVRNWLRAWKRGGLLALIDGRGMRNSMGWDVIDPRYQAAAREVTDALDGDRSTVSLGELDRRIRVKLLDEGIRDLVTPQRITQAYLSALKGEKGSTTRAQKSHALAHVSGTSHFPAIRPGQIVAIDVTRADNLVYDPLTGSPCSVEVITAIDVATRMVLALRVVPRSANAVDAGLLIYDVCRPFSMKVDGTSIGDWRWVGLPENLDLSNVVLTSKRRRTAPDFSTLQGEHPIPSVMPDAVRCDHGSIFVSAHFRAILRDLGIDLLLSRGKKPTDNPHVERWHETLQRALQQIPGYKGRNVSERGQRVSKEPLLTAAELQRHMRRFVALDYHRSHHTGLILPGEPTARLCPLEMWDVMVEATGCIDVPQRPDLIYQFLPIRWATIGETGVELSEMVYDSDALEDYRLVPAGYFGGRDQAAPFFVDPHDLSRIWFSDPMTKRVIPIPWRGANRIDAPLTEAIVDAARQRIRERGGNLILNRGSATRQILAELVQLTKPSKSRNRRTMLAAAARRVEQSREDHAEAQAAQEKLTPELPTPVVETNAIQPQRLRRAWPNLQPEK
jgi:putative transposase